MESTNSKTSIKFMYVFIAVLLGAIVGFLYLGFEWLVSSGSNWLWNDVVQSDIYRWRVIPLALIMSVVFSLVVVLLGQKRMLRPSLSLLDELDEVKKTSIGALVIIIVIGALSLIAGASLGPEASLVAASMGVAAWLSGKTGVLHKTIAFVFSVSSLGALLAAFFNSLLPVIIPLLLLKKKNKLNLISFLIVIFSGVSAWAIVRVIKNEAYIQVPVSGSFSLDSFALAGLLGLLTTLLALAIKWAIHLTFPLVEKLNTRFSLVIGSIFYGTLLGILYLVGGQTVQFSGSEGLKLLSENPAQYTAAALLGLVIVKLLATAWSITTGYRGGLVFPSIYMGVALSLAVSATFDLTGTAETGTIIGAVTGVLIGMTSPILGIVLAFALFPFSLISVVFGAIVGSLVGIKSLAKLQPPTENA